MIGNRPNPQARENTNKELLSSGILVGREPHEPTFTRNSKDLWVTVRGENRIAIVEVTVAKKGGTTRSAPSCRPSMGRRRRGSRPTVGSAFVVSQKASAVDVFAVDADGQGFSRPRKLRTLDIKAQDSFGFTPFLKTSPDEPEAWLSHKLADALSVLDTREPFGVLADKILNHQSGTISGVAAVYQQHEFMNEREEALHLWGKHVAQLTAPAVHALNTRELDRAA